MVEYIINHHLNNHHYCDYHWHHHHHHHHVVVATSRWWWNAKIRRSLRLDPNTECQGLDDDDVNDDYGDGGDGDANEELTFLYILF